MPSKEEQRLAALASEKKRGEMLENFKMAMRIPKFTSASAKLLAQSVYVGLTLAERERLSAWIAEQKDRTTMRDRLRQVLHENQQLLNDFRAGKLKGFLAEDVRLHLEAKRLVEKREKAPPKPPAGKPAKSKSAAKTAEESQETLKKKIEKYITGQVFNEISAEFLAHLFKDLNADKRSELQRDLIARQDARKMIQRLEALETATRALEKKAAKPPTRASPKKPRPRRPR